MDISKISLELKERIEELSLLADMLNDDDSINKMMDRDSINVNNVNHEDWSDDLSQKTYLQLAKQDLQVLLKNKNNLRDSSHTVTVLISQCFEKCLCHLLMLKGELFVPTHSHTRLINHVRKVYSDFPEYFGDVEASLCELWYKTNRYPQGSQRGYESYYLILNMIRICEKLVFYATERDKECKGIKFNFRKYEASRLLRGDEIGELITRDSIEKMNSQKEDKKGKYDKNKYKNNRS